MATWLHPGCCQLHPKFLHLRAALAFYTSAPGTMRASFSLLHVSQVSKCGNSMKLRDGEHEGCYLRSSLLLASVICPLAYTALFPHQRNLWLWTAVLPGTLGFVHLLLSAPPDLYRFVMFPLVSFGEFQGEICFCEVHLCDPCLHASGWHQCAANPRRSWSWSPKRHFSVDR